MCTFYSSKLYLNKKVNKKKFKSSLVKKHGFTGKGTHAHSYISLPTFLKGRISNTEALFFLSYYYLDILRKATQLTDKGNFLILHPEIRPGAFAPS